MNGKLSKIHFNRIFNQGSKNRFLLEFDIDYVRNQINELKLFAYDQIYDISQFDIEVMPDSEQTLIEKYQNEQKFNE